MIEDNLIAEINRRTNLLENIVKNRIVKPVSGKYEPLLRFIIARKWNSWYPSYFDTQGGCYAFITRDAEEDIKKNSGVIVIDPGFDFLKILRRRYNIEPYDLKSIIVSHYHPDHTMGLFELLTLTNEGQCLTKYYLNKATYETFKSFQGKYNSISELTENQILKLGDYSPLSEERSGIHNSDPNTNNSNVKESINIRTFKTFHGEVGNRHTSLGFDFHIMQGNNERELVILGDTDGNEKYLARYLKHIKNAEIVILHLGSYLDKMYKGNKHLYKSGLLNILNCINCLSNGYTKLEGQIIKCQSRGRIFRDDVTGHVHHISSSNECPLRAEGYFSNLKLVIISELGLEMASISDLVDAFGDFNWIPGLRPFLLFAKIYSDDEFDGPEIIMNLLATKSLIFANDFIRKYDANRLICDDILYAESFAAIFCIYFANRTIAQLDSKNNDDLLKKLEHIQKDLFLILSKMSEKPISNFEAFKKEFLRNVFKSARLNSKNNKNILKIGFVNNLQSDLYSFCESLINNIFLEKLDHEFSTAQNRTIAITELMRFIELIASILQRSKIQSRDKFDTNFLIYKFIKDMVLFSKSIELMNDNLIKKIFEKIMYKGSIWNEPIVFLVLSLMHRALSHIRNNGLDTSEMERDASLCNSLKKIFDDYNDNDKGIKFFLTELGTELDLSNELRIRSSNMEWVPIFEATQSIGKNGELIIARCERRASMNYDQEFPEVICPDL